MRILHLLNDVREIGNGIINMAVDLACTQAESNHTVGVASSGGDYETLLSRYGIKHFTLNQTRTPANLVKAVHSYQAIAKEFQPDIVHAHMMTGVILVKFFRGHASYSLVSTVHNEFQRSAILMGLADGVIAVSQAVATSMQQRGIPAQKLHVVLNGTLGSPRNRSLPESQSLPLQRPAILTVAGMYQRKGIGELIDAFCKIAPSFPSVHLYLVGNGPDKSIFEAQACASSVADRIHFEGFQPEPMRYLHSSDIFVLASRQEPFGLVLAEAREAGCAIVASNVDGIPEALDQGEAGILVPPCDSQALADALAQLLQAPEQLNNWRQRSQKNLEWLSVHRVCQQTLAVYEKVIQEKRNGECRNF
ncbi:MAG: glycosyltransferase family 4 protein [Leptolyngbyaceae cyanobacterium bins.349]|nr:glycosyltransferase family 4 protein [Leptolyngbyaceae cyanobacterium bins.349]